MSKHHIALDLDGTLAHYDKWRGVEHIGTPIQPVIDKVKRLLAQGVRVTIFTARVAPPDNISDAASIELATRRIEEWCLDNIGQVLPVTASKLRSFTEFWDDKAVSVEVNQGKGLVWASHGSVWAKEEGE